MGKSFISCKLNGMDIKERLAKIEHWDITQASKDLYFNGSYRQKLAEKDINDIEYNEQEAIIRLKNGDFIALEEFKKEVV